MYNISKHNPNDPIICLAIETSCDETGTAIVRQQKTDAVPEIISSTVASQIDVHALTGGVIPEVAAREHASVIVPLIRRVMDEAGLKQNDISAIAATVAPGLMPALAVGVAAARTLSFAWQKPVVPIHHLEGHIYSALLSADSKEAIFKSLPALALVVSGGHTMLIAVQAPIQYRVLGTTVDDAAGEAFDKVARLLGLPYPGGPALSRLAAEGNPAAYPFPRPMLHSGNLNFSFSGLKTAVLYTLKDIPANEQSVHLADIAASFQQAVIDVLAGKTEAAIKQHHPQTILLSGGVAANTLLREKMQQLSDANGLTLKIAPLNLCGDNAAMIGQIAVNALRAGRAISWQEIDAAARRSIEDFSAPS